MTTDRELVFPFALAFLARVAISLRGRWIEFGHKAVLFLPSGIAWVHRGQSVDSNCCWTVWSQKDHKVFREEFDDPKDFILGYDEAKRRAARALLFSVRRG
ncbi:MAG: hypothetical protein E6R04_01235 [Spirochaetes bacterium]|nr:MAG: hypothetical protein E6R04_01235 [Spirochaetota bacterium]